MALECERYQVTRMESGQAIILGKVLGVHVADDAVLDAAKCYIDTPKLHLVGRMNSQYLRTEEVFPLERLSVERMRHIFVALCLQAQQVPCVEGLPTAA